jgi:hypothetical protein
MFRKAGRCFCLTEKLTKVEIVDIFLNRYGEAESLSFSALTGHGYYGKNMT